MLVKIFNCLMEQRTIEAIRHKKKNHLKIKKTQNSQTLLVKLFLLKLEQGSILMISGGKEGRKKEERKEE